MNSPGASAHRPGHVAIAPGAGIVVRRADAVAYIVEPERGSTADAVHGFVDAASAEDALDAVTGSIERDDAGDEVSAMVIVSWGDAIRIVVFGDVEARTDLPQLSMISGSGSASWVERRIRPDAGSCVVSAGDAASEHTDLGLGRVAGGGFRATFELRAVEPAAPPAAPVEPDRDVAARDGAAEEPSRPSPAATNDQAERRDPSAVLSAATGGDWMEDSLGLGALVSDRGAPVPDEPNVPAPSPSAARTDLRNDEITLAPGDPLPLESPGGPPSPPAWPDTTAEQVDAVPANDSTPEPTPPRRDVGRALVRARHCTSGHPNPPERERCIECGAPIDADTPDAHVAQPTLGLLRGPHGNPVDIDTAIVVGRSPDVDRGRAPHGSRLALEGPAAISRTHVVVRADSWTITVTDCGSRSGTAVAVPGREAVALEAWIPHEAPVGSVIYVGGPTELHIDPPASHRTGDG